MPRVLISHKNKATTLNLHRRASVGSLLRVCAYICVALDPETPSYPSCPPLLWLLNQMVPSFLAVPGHFAPQPTAAWDPEPWKWFITQREGELGSYLSSPPSQSFSPSSLFTPATLHASPITLSVRLCQIEKSISINFYHELSFSYWNCSILSLLLIPLCVSCSWKTQGLIFLNIYVFQFPPWSVLAVLFFNWRQRVPVCDLVIQIDIRSRVIKLYHLFIKSTKKPLCCFWGLMTLLV